MTTLAQHAQALADLTTRLTALAAAVQALKDSIGNTTPEVDAQLTALQAEVDALTARLA